jgi:hypothetical protein
MCRGSRRRQLQTGLPRTRTSRYHSRSRNAGCGRDRVVAVSRQPRLPVARLHRERLQPRISAACQGGRLQPRHDQRRGLGQADQSQSVARCPRLPSA